MYNIIQFPWPHIIIDDFLAKEDWAELSGIDTLTSQVPPTARKSFLNNQVHFDGRVVSGDLSRSLIERLHARYHDRSMELLRLLAPQKLNLYEYADFELVVTGSRCSFAIHDDTWDKLLSIVVYLAPEQNAGTVVYDNKLGINPTRIEWKQNRALIFSRKQGVTWHGYKGDGISNRLALVYNLMTTNMKGVYNAEGINLTKIKFDRLMYRVRKKLGYKPTLTT